MIWCAVTSFVLCLKVRNITVSENGAKIVEACHKHYNYQGFQLDEIGLNVCSV